jgi:hypothetical protein
MIHNAVNNYVWSKLRQDPTLDATYDKYRATYGAEFMPFFPVFDNFAGDISWGTDMYVLYDSVTSAPNRPVYGELREQIMYTVIGPMPDLLEFKQRIIDLFDAWESTTFVSDGYRVNDINVWQPSGVQGRDKVRQTYAVPLMVEVNYIKC